MSKINDLKQSDDNKESTRSNVDNLSLPLQNVVNKITATQASKCNGMIMNEDVNKEFNFVHANEINGSDHTLENECRTEHSFQNGASKTNSIDSTPNCVQNNYKVTIKAEIEQTEVEEASNSISSTANSINSLPEKEKLQIGDLIWSKLTGHPWWPAMISIDPLKDIYHKEVMNRKCHNVYHVQYFGESERGWTVPNGLMKYEGIEKYKTFVDAQINQAMNKTVKRKIIDKFKINPKRLESWTLSVDEAEYAFKMTRERRIKELTYNYTNKHDKKSPKNSTKGPQNGIKREEDSKEFVKNNPDLGSKTSKKLGRPKKDDGLKGVDGENQGICVKCEKPSTILIKCHGVCEQNFHLECLGLDEVPKDYICSNCFSGQQPCIICKNIIEGAKLNKCSRGECKNFFHETCLKSFLEEIKLDSKNTQCPNHFCRSCAIDNPKNQSIRKNELVTCIRCNNAYHSTEHCLPAGSYSITSSVIICAQHFENNNQRGSNKSLWCFKCSFEDEPMVQCKFCPSAFHPNCLETELIDEENFTCENCKVGKYPKTGDIIWAKLSIYRWWPAKICDIADIPPDQQNRPMKVGCFPILLLGTNIYHWANQKQVMFFRKDDDDKRHIIYNSSLILCDKFIEGVTLAIEAFNKVNISKEEKKNNCKNYEKYAPYKFIKVSKPIGQFQLNPFDINDVSRCDCDPNSEHPCSSDIDCLNRSLRYECHPNTCKAGDKCENQRFQKFQYPTFEVFKTEKRGWGLRSPEVIKMGQFVNEYVGDLITEEECQLRLKQMHQNNDTNFYFLTVDKDNIIDAGPKGNYSRFFNHSCDPNMQTQKWEVNGNTRVGLFALKDIPAGSELTFNYNLKSLGIVNKKCECGADNCSKFIGLRPQNISQTKKLNNTTALCASRKRKLDEHRKYNPMCANCHNPGEMIVCNFKNCQKSFHLTCLNMSRPPPPSWRCSYHNKNVVTEIEQPAFKRMKYERVYETATFSIPDDEIEDFISASDFDCSGDDI